ncbi:MAG: DNA mismatch repair protein MutS [Verrucomicrobia bacterium]|nr:DNA mismatch repair protein MutS [Kiritimatiellia bacterium]MCO6401266.1 DNA mismatch repair protein MutS [Verrucomicrobiota bacterium]
MSETTTPMMAQYRRIRSELPPDTILFFRLGDFYEMFFDDAKTASQVLDIALTKRQSTPMCGVPYHSADLYLAKLIRAGLKVAICDQMEDPAATKGIVRREVTRVVTPGTVLEDQVLESRRNNYLASLCPADERFGLAFLDLSTGEFWVEEAGSAAAVQQHLARYAPAECIVPEPARDTAELRALFPSGDGPILTAHDEWTFEADSAVDLLTRHFRVHSLDGFGVKDSPLGLRAAGAVLHYVGTALRRAVDHVRSIRVKHERDFMLLDETTLRNLDLIESSSGGRSATLLSVLDSTRTPMGARMLRDWLTRPLLNLDAIRARHNAVETFVRERRALADLREISSEIRDLERLIARLNAGTGNARDARALGRSLAAIPQVKALVAPFAAALFADLNNELSAQPDLVALLDRALVDEPPLPIKDGGLFKAGYHADLDELRDAASKGKQWLLDFQQREQERTGITSLKVRHNSVFGYFIEVTKSNLDRVPADYIRKQTIANGERYITPELKEYENKILGAQEKSIALEYELFLALRETIVAETATIQRSAAAIAQLDSLAALAERALALGYTRPAMTSGDTLRIKDGRHPVVEALPGADRFVPNDALLDGKENQLILITGPNMAGKSTYIRQVALLVVMAQAGSFVPAAEMEVGIVDRVFTRVGASDDLARGRSTFMVEMQETANILNNATSRSLIVLDEIGRGTSTFDGISIAWAVAEYLHNDPRVKAKTLFATHYHELTDLSIALPGVKNYNVLVRETGDRIAFLRRIVPGAADKSYGIQVARLAGLPPEVVARAREILHNLEEGEFEETGQPKLARRYGRKGPDNPNQLRLFDG